MLAVSKHIFISYGREDDVVMRRVVASLRSHSFHVWVDNEHLVPGTPIWEEEIEKAIRGAFAIVVILSPDSKTSEWVRREVAMADQFRKRIFPVLAAGSQEDSIPLRLFTNQFVDIRTNEEAGFDSLKTAISFYFEELASLEEKAREAAERLARAEQERIAAEREAERLRLENEEAEKAAREAMAKAARERAEKELIEREAARLDVERKAAAEAERIALIKAEKERSEREAAEHAKKLALESADKEKLGRQVVEQEAAQLKAERSAAQKNIFSRMGYVWANWSTWKKIWVTGLVATLSITFLCVVFFAYSVAAEMNRPAASVQFILPGNNPTPIPTDFKTETVYDLAFSPDGKAIVSIARKVRIWNVSDGSLLREIDDFGFAVSVSPDGKRLASTSSASISLWDLQDDTIQAIPLEGHTDTVWDLAFSPDGKYLASASGDETVRIWDTASGTTVYILSEHTEAVNNVAISPDGKTLASSSKDNTVRIWDLENGSLIHTITDLTSAGALAFSPGGDVLVTTTIHEVQFRTLGTYDVFLTISKSNPESIAFSPDGKTLAIGSLDNSVSLWNVSDGAKIKDLTGHTDYLRTLAFSPDGRLLASGSKDGTIRIWEITP